MRILLVTHLYGHNIRTILIYDYSKHWVHDKKWQIDDDLADLIYCHVAALK